jgi:hypothetical protein
LSFWNKKEDAARYHQEQYPKIHEMLKQLLETEPVIWTFIYRKRLASRQTAKVSIAFRETGRRTLVTLPDCKTVQNILRRAGVHLPRSMRCVRPAAPEPESSKRTHIKGG